MEVPVKDAGDLLLADAAAVIDHQKISKQCAGAGIDHNAVVQCGDIFSVFVGCGEFGSHGKDGLIDIIAPSKGRMMSITDVKSVFCGIKKISSEINGS